MPDVEVDRPDRQRDERAARGSRSLSNGRIASTGRSTGPVRPATKHSGARSPSRMCCVMWTKKKSVSPSSSIGELIASTSRKIPSQKRNCRQPRHRLAAPRQRPRAAEVERTRRAPSAASWSGARFQLVRSEASSTPPSVAARRRRAAGRLRAGCTSRADGTGQAVVPLPPRTSQVRYRSRRATSASSASARRALRPRRRAVWSPRRARRAVGAARARRLGSALRLSRGLRASWSRARPRSSTSDDPVAMLDGTSAFWRCRQCRRAWRR